MTDNADNPWGRRLHDALLSALYADTAYAVTPYVRVGLEDFRPDAPEHPDMPDVADRDVPGVLDKLHDTGYLTARTVVHETSSEGYVSDGRTITAVHVTRPFVLVSVDYRFSRDANSRAIRFGHAYADQWEITDRSYIVPAGWYLVGEVGDYVTELSGVAGMDGDSDGCVFELEGFGASSCTAECAACGTRWSAECGSWHFRADECDADAWYFDDADTVDDTTGTVTCPACATGRVGFLIS